MLRSVSIIIPCYNYAEFLPACVKSALTQVGVDVSVLVIDDCSNDDTPAVGAALAADPRVTFRRHVTNLRHLATYNEGLDWADGDFTVLLSADDMLTPGALARAATVMNEYPNVGMAYGHALRFSSADDLPAPRDKTARPKVWRGADWIARRCKTATNTVASPEVVVRTSCYKSLGGYRTDLPHTADLEMWLRIAAHYDIAYLRDVDQAFYRVHQASMSRATYSVALDDLRERKAAFDALFDDYGARVPQAARLREQADRALARQALWSACRAYDRRRLDTEPIDELEAFARQVYPDALNLRESRGLRARRRLGARWSPWLQYVRPSVYIHSVQRQLWWRRLRAAGV